MTGDDDRKWKW